MKLYTLCGWDIRLGEIYSKKILVKISQAVELTNKQNLRSYNKIKSNLASALLYFKVSIELSIAMNRTKMNLGKAFIPVIARSNAE